MPPPRHRSTSYRSSPALVRAGLAAIAVAAMVALSVGAPALAARRATASTSCTSSQWTARYFNNMTLSNTPKVKTCENAIDHDWGTSAPVSGINADQFSVRWTQVSTYAGGDYTFTTTSDDGIRVFLDPGTTAAKTVINDWSDHNATTDTATVTIPAGSHKVVVEYYDHTGSAVAKASITPVASTSPSPSPSPTSSSSSSTCTSSQWTAAYFNNMTLSNSPATTVCDDAINHDWGTSAPVAGVNADGFSTRWTQTVTFAAGDYDFTTSSDDGIRVLLDPGTTAAQTVINDWSDHSATTDNATVSIPAGDHKVVVEYYDNTGSAVAKARWAPAATSSPSPSPTSSTSSSTGSSGVPTQVSGWWWSDQSNVPFGSAGCSYGSGTATANALNKEWDYWDNCGASEVSASAQGLPATPWGGDHVVKWYKPAGDTNVYQKLNRTFTKDNWPQGSAAPVNNTTSPSNVSGDYVVYRYIPSSQFTLNPGHGWAILQEFKENYIDSSGTWHQDSTWGVGCNNFSGPVLCALNPHSSPTFQLKDYMDRWVKWELKVYQGADDKTGHGGRIELWADGKLLDTGYESQMHVGSAAFTSLSNTRAWVWISGQYTSNQGTDYQGTDVTSYVGLSTVLPVN